MKSVKNNVYYDVEYKIFEYTEDILTNDIWKYIRNLIDPLWIDNTLYEDLIDISFLECINKLRNNHITGD